MRLFDHAVARALPVVPRSIVGRVAAPYIAGATLEDARRVVSELNANGMSATVDVLGEEITHPESAETIAAAYASNPPDDEVDVLSSEEADDGTIVARYAWRADNGRAAGRMIFTTRDEQIARLVVTFEP